MPSDKEYRPFRFDEPKGEPDLVMTMQEWEREELERRRRLGPEVAAAEGRTRAEYEAERNVQAPPTTRGGRGEVDMWRRNLRSEAGFDAQGLPDSSPDDPPTATPGNRSSMR